MPVLCDFIQIVGDNPRTIGTTATEIKFSTGGRVTGGVEATALLLFNVRRLTSETVPVLVNNVKVGSIFPYPAADGESWNTQMVALTGSQLIDGENELQLEVASDSFQIKNMVCFFHQAA